MKVSVTTRECTMSSPTPHISSLAFPRGRPRTRIGVHLRVLSHRTRFDEELLGGVDPASTPELRLRARQLTAQRHRRALADSLKDAVLSSERGTAPRFSASVPVGRAERLLTDGNGPLYVRSEHDALWHAAREASAALDGHTRTAARAAG
jgi:hypothetical protein